MAGDEEQTGGAATATEARASRVCSSTLKDKPTTLKVSVRTDFTNLINETYWHASGADYHRAWDGRAVGRATVKITGTDIEATTSRRGLAELDTSALADGSYELVITPEHVTLDPAGPAMGETDPAPSRIYRELRVSIAVQCGQLTAAQAQPATLSDGTRSTTHGKIGHAVLRNWAADSSPGLLPVDLKPVWMQSKRHGGAITPTLIVVHHTGGPQITGALNRLLAPKDPDPNQNASAHYIIDLDGHVVKINQDKVNGWHAGGSSWAGRRRVNEFSIGIEIVHQSGLYPEAQYVALEGLLARLLDAYGIPQRGIVGHSDICLNRQGFLGEKSGDPGVTFEWLRLENRNWGLVLPAILPNVYYGGLFQNQDFLTDAERARSIPIVLREGDRDSSSRYSGRVRNGVPGRPIQELQEDLAHVGYHLSVNGAYDRATSQAVRMFQDHFFSGTRLNQGPHNGLVDARTASTIRSMGGSI